MDSVQNVMVCIRIIGLYSENRAKYNNVVWPNGFLNDEADCALRINHYA